MLWAKPDVRKHKHQSRSVFAMIYTCYIYIQWQTTIRLHGEQRKSAKFRQHVKSIFSSYVNYVPFHFEGPWSARQ